jgi:HTH-type transcriptional regulator / antitoxin HipB
VQIEGDQSREAPRHGAGSTIVQIPLSRSSGPRMMAVHMNDRADYSSTVPGEVRARRRELGLTQQEVADLAGVSTRFVHTVETGKPSLRLDRLLQVLDVLGLGLELVPRPGLHPSAGRNGDAR